MFVIMSLMFMVQMSLMKIIEMPFMLYCQMTAAKTMFVRVIGMLITSHIQPPPKD
jgi:hypothetical protein